jgi:hypothetical protein
VPARVGSFLRQAAGAERLTGLVQVLNNPDYRLGLDDVEPDILGRARRMHRHKKGYCLPSMVALPHTSVQNLSARPCHIEGALE